MISLKPGFVKRVNLASRFHIVSVSFLLIIFSSCNTSLRFAAVKYDAAAINHLLDSTKMKYLTILYNSPDVKSYKSAFTLISYARDSTGGYLNIPAYNLEPQEGKRPLTFTGKTILGNLTLERDSIVALLNDPKTGKRRKDLDYLLFIPMRDRQYNFLYYDVIVKSLSAEGNDTTPKLKTVARPCPPAINCHGKEEK